MDFEPTEVRAARRRASAEGSFWRRFQHPIVLSQKAAPTNIEFSPQDPHDCCISSSLQVDIFSCRSNAIYRTLTRFKDTVRCATYRHDGKMLAAADEAGCTQLFDLGSRAVMRTFRGHERAVRVVRFSADGSRLVTGSDDQRVISWDVASESQLCVLEGHSDFVRCAQVSEASPHMLLTGSYDHTVRLWDVSAARSIMTMRFSNPVEDMALLPGGGMLAVANGNLITVCDLLSGGRVLQSVVAHSKTVTSLHADSSHLISASLDRQVKMYDLAQYKVVGSIKYPAPILCAALSPKRSHLVVGMSDNSVSVRRHRANAARAAAPDGAGAGSGASQGTRSASVAVAGAEVGARPGQVAKQTPLRARYEGAHPGTYRYFLRGRTHAPQAEDLIGVRGKAPKLSSFDMSLKGFRYHEALDAALLTGSAEVVAGVVEELVQRNGLRIALAGRDQQSLQPLIAFLVRHATTPPFGAAFVGLTELLLDMYAPVLGQSAAVDELFVKLRVALEAEAQLQAELSQLMGAMDVLLAGATRSAARATSLVPDRLARPKKLQKVTEG